MAILPPKVDRHAEAFAHRTARMGELVAELRECTMLVGRGGGEKALSAEESRGARGRELVRDGNPIYAWPFEERHVWLSSERRVVSQVRRNRLL